LQAPYSGLRDDSGRLVERNPRSISTGFSWLPAGQLMTAALTKITNFGDLSKMVEVSPHNQLHVFIGGQMGVTTYSPSDPVVS
jgi:hypothetical protein